MEPGLISKAAFSPGSRADWLALVARSLGDLAFDDALVSHTADDIRLDPLYSAAEPRLLPRAAAGDSWAIVARVDDPDPARANRQALEDLRSGASGLAVVFEGAPNAYGYGLPSSAEALAAALDGIEFNRQYLRIETHPNSRASAEWLVRVLARRKTDLSRLDLSFGIDPAAIFAGTGRLRMSLEALEAYMPQSLGHFFALGIPGVLLEADGRVAHNAGGSEAQEIGFMLASAASHLRMFEKARQPLIYSAPHIGFAVSADHDQFLTTAKIRALRLAWRRMQEACGIEPTEARIHAETSYRSIALRDPENNVLRSTIAAFAAATGGADSVTVLPHTTAHGLPDATARRLSRNVQVVLAEESRIGFVADPASGAGVIEHLTDQLCEAGWKEFQAIEKEGGLLQSLAEGRFQARVAEAAQRRAAAIRSGGRPIVGVTRFPLAAERPVTVLPAEPWPASTEGASFCEQLAPRRDEAASETSA